MPDLAMRRVLVVPYDLGVDITELRIYVGDGGLAALQAIVEGGIEAVPYIDRREDVSCFFNDEGKLAPLPAENHRATRLLAASLLPGDYLAGNVVLAGNAPDTGELIDLPRDLTANSIEAEIAEPAPPLTRGELLGQELERDARQRHLDAAGREPA